MRAVILSFAIFLVELSSANCQVYDESPNILGIMETAFEEIVNAIEVGLNDCNTQKEIFFKQFEDLGTYVGVTGPIPAVVQIVFYWFDNFIVYDDLSTDKIKGVISQILQSIYYQIVQHTQCSPYDLNLLINDNLQILGRNINGTRSDSEERLQTILAEGRNEILGLHQLGLSDCGAHLVELNKQGAALANLVIAKLEAEIIARHNAIRHAASDFLNSLYANIKQLISTPPPVIARPAIAPPV